MHTLPFSPHMWCTDAVSPGFNLRRRQRLGDALDAVSLTVSDGFRVSPAP